MQESIKPKRFRIKAACRIAGIEHQRFNEAVASGHYPCAPKVDRGSTRVFDLEDLVALYFYGSLLEQGWPPRLAGQYACRIHDCLISYPQTTGVMVIRLANGSFQTLAESELNGTPKGDVGGGVMQRFSFDIETARKYIDREIDEEISIVGEDD